MSWLVAIACISPVIILLLCDLIMCIVTYFEINVRGKTLREKKGQRSLMPTCITLWHSFSFMGQKWSYELHIFHAILYIIRMKARKLLGSKSIEASEEDVVKFLLNTTLVIYTNVEEKGDAAEFTLELADFRLHVAKEVINRMIVKYEVRQIHDGGTKSSRVISFVLNEQVVTCPTTQLSILLLVLTAVVHPQVHSFFETVYYYRDKPDAEKYDDFFLHGQYLNHRANFYPSYTLGLSPNILLQCLLYNARKAVPFHGFSRLSTFAKYSRFVRFLLGARQAFKSVCREHNLPVPAEYLFISSVLHSADHYSMWIHVKDRYLSLQALKAVYHPNINLFSAYFVAPSQYIFSNLLRRKKYKTKAYATIYQKLSAIDKEFADNVTLSISY